ncbi:glycosyltransferase [Candidatus Gottesmanbacteria bacterium]|nr:glycosyltransferase [Candidatus Gottesmanbacteria bacterium]
MRIGLLLPSIYMSPKRYGEMIFAPRDLAIDLADGLVSEGHEVYFFTTPDTPTKAKIISGDPNLLGKNMIEEKMRGYTERAKWSSFFGLKRNYEIDLTSRCYKMAKVEKFDIIHSYHDTMAHFFDTLSLVPTVYTLHDPLPIEENGLVYWLLKKFKDHPYVSISNSFRHHKDLKLNFIDTVYHGVKSQHFPVYKEASDYFLFMGRLIPEKGLHHAISACLAVNNRLEIGTEFPDATHESDYFVNSVKPYLGNKLIGKPGMVNGRDKFLLYGGAQALLFPIEWEEPFGMVMIEAMACGTPVIAFARGAVSEIVIDGVTGFLVNSDSNHRTGDYLIKEVGEKGLIEALKKLQSLAPFEYKKMRENSRLHVEKNFSIRTFVGGYEKVYQKVIKMKKASR